MRHRRQKQLISNINVVPYLDVLLVLLIIFMITAPLFNQGIVELPKVGKTPLAKAQESELEVVYEEKDANPYTLINRRTGDELENLKKKDLLIALEDERDRIETLGFPIIIAADEELSYGEVFDLLGELRDAGYKNLVLAAENEAQQ